MTSLYTNSSAGRNYDPVRDSLFNGSIDRNNAFANDEDNTPPMTLEQAKSICEAKGYVVALPSAESSNPFRRKATPFLRGSPSRSSSSLSDPPDSEIDEPLTLSRKSSNISLPDAPSLPTVIPITTPTRPSSMRKFRRRTNRRVRFEDSLHTQARPPRAPISRLQAAGARCRKFIYHYDDLTGIDNSTRSPQCRPMFHLSAPPFLSADEKTTYAKEVQSLIDTLNLPSTATRGMNDRASRARNALWKLWFASRDEWEYLKRPIVNLDTNITYMAYDRARHCHLSEDGDVYVVREGASAA